MSAPSSTSTYSPWLWIVAAVWTAVTIGLGLWVAVATGQWIALVLAIGLAAPIDVMVIRRVRQVGSRNPIG